MSKKELDEAVPVEAADYLPIPINETYLDYQILITHPDEPLLDILVVATPKRLVDDYIELANLAGFELAALETKPLAIGRAIISKTEKDGNLIIEIGTEFSRISVWDGNSIRLTSMMGIGKNQILDSMGIDMNDKNHEKPIIDSKTEKETLQLISQISDEALNSIRYHQNRDYKPKDIKHLMICGAGANISGIDKQIEKDIKIKTDIICPVFTNGDKLGTEFTTAFGLAMRNDF